MCQFNRSKDQNVRRRYIYHPAAIWWLKAEGSRKGRENAEIVFLFGNSVSRGPIYFEQIPRTGIPTGPRAVDFCIIRSCLFLPAFSCSSCFFFFLRLIFPIFSLRWSWRWLKLNAGLLIRRLLHVEVVWRCVDCQTNYLDQTSIRGAERLLQNNVVTYCCGADSQWAGDCTE